MKKIIILFILVAIVLLLFAGCEDPGVDATQGTMPPTDEATEPSSEATEPSSEATEPSGRHIDPNVLYNLLSEDLKQEISEVMKVDWDYIDPYYGSKYYGTINGCSIIRVPGGIDLGPTHGRFEVAGYMFEWSSDFDFRVYRDGEVCTLEDAYEKGWLTKKQIEAIHAKNHGCYAEKIRKAREIDDVPSDYTTNYLYRDPLSEQMKQEISEAFLDQYNIAVDWNYAYSFYGTVNGCAILMTTDQESEPAYCMQEIVRTPFEWRAPFRLYAYRDGEICELQEAYDKEWLTRDHIEMIRERNIQHYVTLYKETHVIGEAIIDSVSPDPNVLSTTPLSEDQKENIRSWILMDYDKTVRWGYVDPYYGVINDCFVVVAHPFGLVSEEDFCEVIAGYTFEWDTPIDLFVYRKGSGKRAYELKEAYEKGWLTKEQIGIIHEKHEEYRANFPQMLEQWQKDQKETQGN